MNITERHIEVDKEFFAKLSEHLQPEERWCAEDNPNTLVLYSIKDFYANEFVRLYFVMVGKKEDTHER